MSDDMITVTGQWSLSIHRVSESQAEVWLGTLFPTLKMPDKARLELIRPDGSSKTININKDEWKRPFKQMKQRFYTLCTIKNLQAGNDYKVIFSRKVEAIPGIRPSSWQKLRQGKFTTLPSELPAKGSKPFTVGLGSCFYNHRDGGQAASAYKALYERGPDKVRPDITFLTGDQVYLDIGFDSLSLIPKEIRHRIADDYAAHWQALGSILNRGGTWMLPDDHEYWNDYPFYDSCIPTLLALKLDYVRKTWNSAAKDAVQNIQRSAQVETFKIGDELSFCIADLRSYRKENGFTSNGNLNKIIEWAKSLNSPGVFVSPQPLIVNENDTERNLLSFDKQYSKLLAALSHSGHDIVVLSGDVHYGRIASVPLGNNGSRLIEIISSPMSNLTGLNGIATSTTDYTPKKFPSSEIAQQSGLSPSTVIYDRAHGVSSKKGWLFSAYPKPRTTEHFMTLSFHKLSNGKVELSAEAWRIRERNKTNNLPRKDFKKTFKTTLK